MIQGNQRIRSDTFTAGQYSTDDWYWWDDESGPTEQFGAGIPWKMNTPMGNDNQDDKCAFINGGMDADLDVKSCENPSHYTLCELACDGPPGLQIYKS